MSAKFSLIIKKQSFRRIISGSFWTARRTDRENFSPSEGKQTKGQKFLVRMAGKKEKGSEKSQPPERKSHRETEDPKAAMEQKQKGEEKRGKEGGKGVAVLFFLRRNRETGIMKEK